MTAPEAVSTVDAPPLTASEVDHVAPSSTDDSMPAAVATYTVEPFCANCVASLRSTFAHERPPFVERKVPPNSVAASSTDGFVWSSQRPLTTDDVVPSRFVRPLSSAVQCAPPSVVP